jgi:hypothetical protein
VPSASFRRTLRCRRDRDRRLYDSGAAGRGSWSAVLVTVGLAVSVLPILLRALPPLHRDARTQQRHARYWITVLGLVLYAGIITVIVAHP